MGQTDPIAAHGKLEDARPRVTEAERAVSVAEQALDHALAERGWQRLVGGFTSGAEPIYTHGDEVAPLSQLITKFEQAAA
jgi:hypothetical protein